MTLPAWSVDDFSRPQAAEVLEEMDPDDAADVVDEMGPIEAEAVLVAMKPDDANDLRELLSSTAGMSRRVDDAGVCRSISHNEGR